MDTALQLFGVLSVCLALADVYRTILFARSGTGLLSPWLHRGVWGCTRGISARFPGARMWLLPHSGPMMLVATMLLWAALLVGGFALVVWPELGSAVQASGGGPTPRTFATALYFAGYNLTTLGTGDLVPKRDLFRVLMVLMAGIGFSFLTLTLTYFMSIYTALQRRNRFALMLHHRTGDSGDAVDYVVRLLTGGTDSEAIEDLRSIESSLDDLYESHHFYSILHYFYFPDPYYAMSRMLLIVMDSISLIRSVVEEDEFELLIRSAAVHGLWTSGAFFLKDLAGVFLPRSAREGAAATDEEILRWETRYLKAVERVRAMGVAVRKDQDAGLERYIELRREWNGIVLAFARYMHRDWQEVTADPGTE